MSDLDRLHAILDDPTVPHAVDTARRTPTLRRVLLVLLVPAVVLATAGFLLLAGALFVYLVLKIWGAP